jgi:hypothetical protein
MPPRLAQVCGHHPLALRIAAGILADTPDLAPTELAADLAAAPIDAFTHGDTAVVAVLDMSLERLRARNHKAAGLLRLMAFNPGPYITADTTAVMVKESRAEVTALLRTLQQAHLVWQVIHDAIMAYRGLPNQLSAPTTGRQSKAGCVVFSRITSFANTVTPQSFSVCRLRSNAGCAASVGFAYGTTVIGSLSPSASLSNPRANVSLMPATHLFIVLNVAGTTKMASANGNVSASSGRL